ncbi:MAG: hypothetical protein F4X82_01850 [Candidatus Spechtbacteria bacterium SB0662_bin_43]|uniref:Uncharacterized protein n=1 Tax=Candidatus Spechtbacteria bacterium SB0662_bin_43 TaxID=2604897 RepID=A0A845DJ74_9BACT|nr:hypothetical protein [Candidatus Spechtbacteria bacterium SB0662_bin_43]
MERYEEPTKEEMAISALFFGVLILGWILFGFDFVIGYLLGTVIMFGSLQAFLKGNFFKHGGQK